MSTKPVDAWEQLPLVHSLNWRICHMDAPKCLPWFWFCSMFSWAIWMMKCQMVSLNKQVAIKLGG